MNFGSIGLAGIFVKRDYALEGTTPLPTPEGKVHGVIL